MTKAVDPTLEALCGRLPPEDAQLLREERAAILEHEAGFTREEAEARAGPSSSIRPSQVRASDPQLE
jgi:hypothetical protein